MQPSSSGIQSRSASTPIKVEGQSDITFDDQTLVNEPGSPNSRMDDAIGEAIRQEMEESKKKKRSRKLEKSLQIQ